VVVIVVKEWSKQPANAMICAVLRVKTTRETQI
jgi:hypothetical protein